MNPKSIHLRLTPHMYNFLERTAKKAGVKKQDIARIAIANLEKKNIDDLPLFRIKE